MKRPAKGRDTPQSLLKRLDRELTETATRLGRLETNLTGPAPLPNRSTLTSMALGVLGLYTGFRGLARLLDANLLGTIPGRLSDVLRRTQTLAERLPPAGDHARIFRGLQAAVATFCQDSAPTTAEKATVP